MAIMRRYTVLLALGFFFASGVALAFEPFPKEVPVVKSCADGQHLVPATRAKVVVIVEHGQAKIAIAEDAQLLDGATCRFQVSKPGYYKDHERVPAEETAGQVSDDADRCNRTKKGDVFRWWNTPAYAAEKAVVADFTKGVPAHCEQNASARDAGSDAAP